VIRVVENERGGLIACPTSYSVADEPVNVSDAAYAMLGFGASSGSGFAGAGRVHIARPFILSLFVTAQVGRRVSRSVDEFAAEKRIILGLYHVHARTRKTKPSEAAQRAEMWRFDFSGSHADGV
jgi:hypothetical protein